MATSSSQNFESAININYSHFTTNLGAHLSSFKVIAPEKINLYNRSLLGIYMGDIREIYADFKYDLPSNRTIGLKVFSTQQSPELSRSKIHGFYSTEIKISNSFKWYTGIQIGLVNAYVGPTASTAGEGQWAFDGSASTHFSFNDYSIGLALHQFSSTTLSPKTYVIPLSRYLDLIALKKFEISQKLTLTSGIKALISEEFNQYNLDNNLEYNEQISALLALSGIAGYGLSVGGGYKFKINQKHFINAQLTYETATRMSQFNANIFKINIAYGLK